MTPDRLTDEQRAAAIDIVLALDGYDMESPLRSSRRWPQAGLSAGEPRTTHDGGESCARCGGPNLTWWVDSAEWNRAERRTEDYIEVILCPGCFAADWEEATGLQVVWELRLDPSSADLRRLAAALPTEGADHGE